MWALFLAISVTAQVPETATKRSVGMFVMSLPATYLKVKPVRDPQTQEYILAATSDISPRDSVATLPISFAITSFDSFPLSAAFSQDSEEFKAVARLLYERFYGANNTFPKRWVDTFPGNATNLFFWSEEERATLRKFDSFGIWNDQIDFRSLYASFVNSLKAAKGNYTLISSYEAFLWGYAQFFQRCFGLPKSYWKMGRGYQVLEGDDDIEGVACYPLVDMAGYCTLNNPHYPQPLSVSNENGTVSLVLKSEFSVNKTHRFCLSLGRYSAFETLLYQGRAFERNPFNSFFAILPAPPKLPCTGTLVGKHCKFTLEATRMEEMLLLFLRNSEVGKQLGIVPNTEFTNHFKELGRGKSSETQKMFVTSLRKYRKVIVEEVLSKPSHSLRESKRQLARATSNISRLTQVFAVSVLIGPYAHLQHVDRALMQVLSVNLGF